MFGSRYLYPLHRRWMKIQWGRRSQSTKLLKERKLNWNFLRGMGFQTKTPSMGDYGYFLQKHISHVFLSSLTIKIFVHHVCVRGGGAKLLGSKLLWTSVKALLVFLMLTSRKRQVQRYGNFQVLINIFCLESWYWYICKMTVMYKDCVIWPSVLFCSSVGWHLCRISIYAIIPLCIL